VSEPKFGGINVTGAKRLKTLEAKNAKLKRLLADAELDKLMMKELSLSFRTENLQGIWPIINPAP